MVRIVGMLLAALAALAGDLKAEDLPADAADQPTQRCVDDFEDVQNHLGGYRNPFQRAPSRVRASRVTSEFHGGSPTGHSVRIEATRAEQGFCGYWLHFFDFKAADRKYFDSRRYEFLSFWVKGVRGKEPFLIKLSDRRWIERDDALPVGSIDDFLPGGVTGQWREVLIPLAKLPQLNRQELGGMTIEFVTPGEHVIFLDNVSFKVARDAPPAANPTGPAIVARPDQRPRKLWVWKTEPLLRDEAAGRELLDFCAGQGIDQLWLQLLYSVEPTGAGTGAGPRLVTIHHSVQLRRFLRQSHARGIRVDALDGAPHYSQRAHHGIPLGVVDAVIAFNRAGDPDERFDGVHFDNEPYLLVGWADPQLRAEILLEFLELNAECQRRIDAVDGLTFGIDIPFWWQARDARTGRAIGEVTFRGRSQAASYHCIEMLDNVGVMNYRDTADGADGMIAHGRDLLRFADGANRATLWMGAETFQGPPAEVYFAFGLRRAQFFAALRAAAQPLARTNTLLGFRLQTMDDGRHVHVGIEVPPDRSPERKRDARRALRQLARLVGQPPGTKGEADLLQAVVDFVATDPEWSGVRGMAITDDQTDGSYPGFRLTRTMPAKITFADDPPQQFVTEVAAAERYFGRYRSFGGMAVHYYDTFRTLVQPISGARDDDDE